MRGLRLFVRPIEPSDRDAVNAFLARQLDERAASAAATATLPEYGLLGKLLGDIVAVVAIDIADDAVRIADVIVARELRRKWIGRVMMRELEQFASKMDRRRLVVDDARDAHEFFRRVGFQSEGERWVRLVP